MQDYSTSFYCILLIDNIRHLYYTDDPSEVSTQRSWEMEKHKIKALDDNYRWKLNELGVGVNDLILFQNSNF